MFRAIALTLRARLRENKVASRLFIDRAASPPHEEGNGLEPGVVALSRNTWDTTLVWYLNYETPH